MLREKVKEKKLVFLKLCTRAKFLAYENRRKYQITKLLKGLKQQNQQGFFPTLTKKKKRCHFLSMMHPEDADTGFNLKIIIIEV